MKFSIDKKRVKLYIWIGAAYMALWMFSDLISETETFLQRVVNHFWLIGYLVVAHYILFEYTLPFIKLTWKRLLIAPVLLFAHAMILSFGFYAWRWILIQLHVYFELRVHPTVMEGVSYHVSYSFMSVVFFGFIKYTYDYRQLKAAAQQLRIEKQEAELNYLKSQTNPHFLFNTLNNIYALARDKSDLTPDSILRLSEIMRFMLYETGGDYIAIEQELKIIDDYIALEKLRYDDSLRINFNYDIEDLKQAVPPLLLIPLVENAFKHGASETGNHPFVDIHVRVKERILECTIRNSAESLSADRSVKENIGLSNLRRQLELQYKEYELFAERGEKMFTAQLKINLASHV